MCVDVNASINKTDCVNVELNGRSSEAAVRNLVILLLEIVGIDRPV